jgi:hypothetical protein
LKLAAALCEPGAAVNEDVVGWIGEPDNIRAAWVLDGVTGINGRSLLGQPTDAAWFAARIDARLRGLMDRELGTREILTRLVEGLREDQAAARAGTVLPNNYETPAACIAGVHRIDGIWHGFRLGDCRLMAVTGDGRSMVLKEPGLEEFETALKEKADRLRKQGIADPRELRLRLDADQRALRARRNTPGGYGVIVADPVCLDFIEARSLGRPQAVLLCSDGLYRAVDHYGLHDDRSLMEAAASAGLDGLYAELRRIEVLDAQCRRYPRLKPSDDAAAIALI